MRMDKNEKDAQRGLALVTVLLLLLILSVLGTTAFLTAGTDLKIGTNVQQNLEALYAAEAGVHLLLDYYRTHPGAFWQKRGGSGLNLPAGDPGRANWRRFRVWLEEVQYDASAPVPRFVAVTVQALDPVSQSRARIRANLISDSTGVEALPELFSIGLATAGRLSLADPAQLQTDGHANSGYSLPPEVQAEMQRQGRVLSQSSDPAGPDYRPPLAFPPLTDEDRDYYRLLAQSGDQGYFAGNVTLQLHGDQKGRLLFVEGDVTVQGSDLSGLTLVSTGSITLTGNSCLNSQGKIDTAFFSGGNLILKNTGEAAGLFWCQGAFQAGGTGKVQGLVASRLGISSAGPFLYERNREIQNAYLPPSAGGNRFWLRGWLQL